MIDLVLAKAKDKQLYKEFFNLMQNDLSPFVPEYDALDVRGYFDAATVDPYFSGDKAIFPYIIKKDGKNVGIVVASAPPYALEGCDFCVQELFVLGAHRGTGLAREAVDRLMQKHKGKWCALVLQNNPRALKFWRKLRKEEFFYDGQMIAMRW